MLGAGGKEKKARRSYIYVWLSRQTAKSQSGYKYISDSYRNDVEMRIENELNKVVGFLYAKMPNEELVVTLDQEVPHTAVS